MRQRGIKNSGSDVICDNYPIPIDRLLITLFYGPDKYLNRRVSIALCSQKVNMHTSSVIYDPSTGRNFLSRDASKKGSGALLEWTDWLNLEEVICSFGACQDAH